MYVPDCSVSIEFLTAYSFPALPPCGIFREDNQTKKIHYLIGTPAPTRFPRILDFALFSTVRAFSQKLRSNGFRMYVSAMTLHFAIFH